MPNLTLTNITAALAALGSAAFLTSCTKQEIAPDPAKITEIPSATVAASVAPTPAPVAAAPDSKEKEESAADASAGRKKTGGVGGAASGQMSCGAGKCSGEVSGKKK